MSDKKSTRGAALVGGSMKFNYVYDFGDDWIHEVRVEAIIPDQRGVVVPSCTGGANRCPPEDVGGPPGYAGFLAAINDPRHPDHQGVLDWCGGAFDPAEFSLDAINQRLRRLKP